MDVRHSPFAILANRVTSGGIAMATIQLFELFYAPGNLKYAYNHLNFCKYLNILTYHDAPLMCKIRHLPFWQIR